MIAVDLFAGSGGALLGLHRAGLHHAAAVEWSEAETHTLRAAVGDSMFALPHPAWGAPSPGLVRGMDVREWTPCRADLWWASPPCQPWSAAGERLGAEDSRNGWPWLLYLLDAARSRGIAPRWLVTENVSGLLHHTSDHEQCPGCYWADVVVPQISERFDHVSWWQLDAADYGVPQRRRRVFLVAGPAPVPAPPPTHSGEALEFAKAHGRYWAAVRAGDWAELDARPGELRPWRASSRSPVESSAATRIRPTARTRQLRRSPGPTAGQPVGT